MIPQHRTDLALEFLQRWRPEGAWILSAATPDREKMVTRTFQLSELEAARAWIESFQGIRNLYFTVNPVRQAMDTKPMKVDISALAWLHVDADPRVGEDFAAERIRILSTLENFKPAPTVIIDSGGGYQAFWRLAEPIPLDGTEEMAVDHESYNQQLELLLGGDHTFNLDRIMRLPGTINMPTDAKKRKGRIPALSSVIRFDGVDYPIATFTRAPRIQVKEKGGALSGGGERVKVSGDLPPVYVDDLEKAGINITGNVKVLIVQGCHPDEPTKYSSRSEALWAVCCALVRAGATDDMIAGVIMNRDNGIAASVLDKPRPLKYATKQIQDAREEAEDPWLRKLNEKHAVISDIGGKCRIISEVMDHALRRPRISYQSFEDFSKRYLNVRVEVGQNEKGEPQYKPVGTWWTHHVQRRQYETIVFAPGHEVPDSYNLWKGFACEAIPGDCGLFLDHIRNNICGGDATNYNYLIGWMARAVQKPDCPGEVAVVLRGRMGTGKGVFVKGFGSLWGRHYMQVSDPKHLVGSFNAHLRDCVVLFGDEAFYAGDKKHESVLKALVTEEHLAIESKGIDVIASPNYTHILLASNSNWVVPAGPEERRFFVLEVSDKQMQNSTYFAAIKEQLDRGGREALLHHLMTYDLAEFQVRDFPRTGALQDQKLLSYTPEEQWWFEKLEEGRILPSHDRWEREVQKHGLQDDYIFFMQRIGVMRRAGSTLLAKFLARVLPGGAPSSHQRLAECKILGAYGEELTVTRRVYFYDMPSIEACREWWDKNHGGPFKWHAPLEAPKQLSIPDQDPFS